ncbi:MAG TPA: hypothetical protein VFI73_11590 [Candidatus Nitrosopolaris sp.]|nr:hypothetical protein [Candidatus Nitrosopolaris sp.]
MKKNGPSKTMKTGPDGSHREMVRDIKHKRIKKRHDRSKIKNGKHAIVRVMGQGQFRINNRTARMISKIDRELVKIIQTHEQGEKDYSRRVAEVVRLVLKAGLPLEHKEIVQSDIIVPGADISIDDAKNLFRNQGLIH